MACARSASSPATGSRWPARTWPLSRSPTTRCSSSARSLVPLNILLKARARSPTTCTTRGARAFLCFEGSAELPLGAEGSAAFAQVDGCEHAVLMTASPARVRRSTAARPRVAALIARPAGRTSRPCRPDADDTAVILYTSGTTGTPKGAELSHSNLAMNAMACVGADASSTAATCTLVALPLFHTFGQTVQMNARGRLRREPWCCCRASIPTRCCRR